MRFICFEHAFKQNWSPFMRVNAISFRYFNREFCQKRTNKQTNNNKKVSHVLENPLKAYNAQLIRSRMHAVGNSNSIQSNSKRAFSFNWTVAFILPYKSNSDLMIPKMMAASNYRFYFICNKMKRSRKKTNHSNKRSKD